MKMGGLNNRRQNLELSIVKIKDFTLILNTQARESFHTPSWRGRGAWPPVD